MVKRHSWQREGIKWMCDQEASKSHGILADEMGLGKTLQCVVLIKKRRTNTLLILPSSIVHQWQEILTNFNIPHELAHKTRDPIQRTVILTHGQLRYLKRDHPIHQQRWGRIILDEAHIICNPYSNQSKALRKIKAIRKWAVTGTPMLKSTSDIKQYGRWFKVPDWREIDCKEFIESYMLRRTVASTNINLPDLTQSQVRIQLGDSERKQYHKMMQKLDALQASFEMSPLEKYIRLEQLSTIPQHGRHKVFEKSKDPNDIGGHPVSEKLNYIVSDIASQKERAIVFCRFTEEINQLEMLLRPRHTLQRIDGQHTYKPPSSNWQQNLLLINATKALGPEIASGIADFLAPAQVILAQVKAASCGLNLQAYSQVYFTLPMWNPFTQQQAIARAYRFGQTKPVHVKILTAVDPKSEFETFDELLYNRQELKIATISKVIV